MNRREILKTAVAGALALSGRRLFAQQAAVNRLTDKVAVINGGGANVVAFAGADGLFVVDSGAPKSGDQVMAALKSFAPNDKINTLFNTHYHHDQTANNEMFAAAGAKIVSQMRTQVCLKTDIWVPAEDRYDKARPKAAWPTETFLYKGSTKSGSETIEYAAMIEAHTHGDAYYHFKEANVIVAGDVASPERDPSLDWFAGGFIGGRVDGMNTIVEIANDQTKIVPAYGPVMTKAQFKAERDVMEEVRARVYKGVIGGQGPQDMVEMGVLKDVGRTWKDPYMFLYAACKGCAGHNNQLDPSMV